MNTVSPYSILRDKRLWMVIGVPVGALAFLFAVLYVGANVDPGDHLHKLPIGLVNADEGTIAGGKQVNLGADITSSIQASAAGNDKFEWKLMTSDELHDQLGQGKLYGALVVPRDFSASAIALTGSVPTAYPVRPQLQVLTNASAGSMGSSIARTATTAAAEIASRNLGDQLSRTAGSTALPDASQVTLADPILVKVADGHPLPANSGLGLTAFYYALALVVCGMLAANVINGQVDHALGYAHTDLGPVRSHRPRIDATRVQALAINTVTMGAMSVLIGTLVLAGAVAVMGMDASHLPLLWLFSVCTIAATGAGALALLAVFGTPGMLAAAVVFVAMAVPTAGATTPLQALPDVYRFLAEFEPLRQVNGAIRAILYYDAQGDAGLTRGWSMLAAGLSAALVFGFGTTALYDRNGLDRVPPPSA
jgi:YhgE/Pip-like protein